MASLMRQTNGGYMIQFMLEGRRPTIRIGMMKRSDAKIALGNIEKIVWATKYGDPIDTKTRKWLVSLPRELQQRIANTGIIQLAERGHTLVTLTHYVEEQFAGLAKNTRAVQFRTHRSLKDFFGENRPISSITKGDANEFRRYMETRDCRIGPRKKKGLAPATVSRRAKHAKRIFQMAVDKKWIEENPFAGMKGWVSSNPDRNFFIDREVADQVLSALPSSELKLLFALGRYGGLRLPSEAKALKWEFVNWDKNRFTVFAPKQQRHMNKKYRVVPIFPELRSYFDDAWAVAPDKVPWVIPYLHEKSGQAFSSMLKKTLARLGISPWEKLLQNLRVSRSNEVEAEFGAKLEEVWIGHSLEVARENYLMALEADFDRATGIQKVEVSNE